jgi:hypothetical protein
MKQFFTSAALVLLFASCKKDAGTETPGTGAGTNTGTTTGTRLARIGVKSGSDSSTISYAYNSNARVTEYKIVGTRNGQAVNETVSFVRNPWNIITQQVYKSNSLTPYGISQLVTDFIYDDVNSRYKYSVRNVTIAGATRKDSVVYSYDATGRLSAQTTYVSDGGAYGAFSKEEYSYSGNNVVSRKTSSYVFQSNSWQETATKSYEYDNRTNPLMFTTDAIPMSSIADLATFFSPNNVLKSITSAGSGSGIATFSYNYNDLNRPVVADFTDGGINIKYSYYYE